MSFDGKLSAWSCPCYHREGVTTVVMSQWRTVSHVLYAVTENLGSEMNFAGTANRLSQKERVRRSSKCKVMPSGKF